MATKKRVRVTRQTTETKAPATTEKFPELRAAMQAMQAEREKILAASASIRDKRDKLRDELSKKEADLRAMNEQILGSAENRRLFELDNQIGALARTMGARSMRESTGS